MHMLPRTAALPRRPRTVSWIVRAGLFTLTTFAVLAAAAQVHPRAQLAQDSRAIASGLAMAAGGAFGLELANALGGAHARLALMSWLGDVAAALDVPAVADTQWNRALALADRLGESSRSLELNSWIARSATMLGNYDHAQKAAQRAEQLGRLFGDVAAQAQAANALGIIERRRGHLDRAAILQQQALSMFTSIDDEAGTIRALTDLGTVWRDRGDFAKALQAQLDAASKSRVDSDRLEYLYRNLGLLYRDIDDAASSRSYFQRALAEADARGAPTAYSTVVGSYASLLNELGDYAGARDAAAEALAIDSAIEDRPHQGLDLLELGRALLGLHENKAAIAHLEQALQLGRDLRQREIVARALLHLAEAAMADDDLLRARGHIDEAIAALESTRLRQQLAQAYSLRQKLAENARDYADALRYAHKYIQVRDELVGIRTSRQLAALEVRHERADTEQRIAMLAKDNELQAERIQRQTMIRDISWMIIGSLALAVGALVLRYRGTRRFNRELAANNAEIRAQSKRLDAANAALRNQQEALRRAATTDSLTQVANRGHLLQQIADRLLDASEQGQRLAVLLIDFDNFKKINDAHGHLFGDQVLIAGARAINACLGEGELLGRYGGEEFVVMLNDRQPESVSAFAEHLRAQVTATLALTLPQLGPLGTISIGVACLSQLPSPVDLSALLDAADRALYMAKRDGRNRVREYRPSALAN